MNNTQTIETLKARQHSAFLKKGVAIAIMSGFFYGPYSGFITLGMSKGVWLDWSVGDSALSPFFTTIVVGALASIINDCFSLVWALLNLIVSGRFRDYTLAGSSKPGRLLALAAFMDGPVANVATIIALRVAGSAVIPITALSCAFGAFFGRILYKQPLNLRMGLGIFICFLSSTIIGLSASTGGASDNLMLGIILAIVAALGWGIEGCIGGYSTVVLDPEVAIFIRQKTSVIGGLLLVLPLLSFIGGSVGTGYQMALQAITDFSSLPCLILSGLFTVLSYMNWYRGSGICGAALGMSCNGAYAFWGPLWCWIILGLFAGQDGWALPAAAWLATLLMVFGIVLIALNPLDLLKRKGKETCDYAD